MYLFIKECKHDALKSIIILFRILKTLWELFCIAILLTKQEIKLIYMYELQIMQFFNVTGYTG